MANHIYFTEEQIQERPNSRYPTADRHQIHYHFRPARPANFCVTRDYESGEVNVSAGTIGPLTWVPYTMCLHIQIKGSPHTYQNLIKTGKCVISLPGRDIVNETWFTALPLPRGVDEAAVAGLNYIDMPDFDIPGIDQCAVNFKCIVEKHVDYYTHGIFFVRVVGATLDERVLSMKREEVVNWYPTYEVDDITNEFGGSIERLGVMGELFACPGYPRASKGGWYRSYNEWMTDLEAGDYLNHEEAMKAIAFKEQYDALFYDYDNAERAELKEKITELCASICKLDWDAVHEVLK